MHEKIKSFYSIRKVIGIQEGKEGRTRMKAVRNPTRHDQPRRSGNAIIIAAMLISLCALSLVKSRYCSAPYAESQRLAEAEALEASGASMEKKSDQEPALAVDEDEGTITATPKELAAEKAASMSNKPICSETSKRSDVCQVEGDVRLQGSSQIIFLPPSLTDREWKTKPYCRKHDPPAMRNVKEWTLKPFPGDAPPPQCSVNHTAPALVFSIAGFTGNLFHDFTDVLVPLFISAYQFRGEVQFVIAEHKSWWVSKFALIFKQLSNYEIIGADNDDRGTIHCFPRVIVGLSYHKELSADPARTPTGYTMAEFKSMLRKAYGLERPRAVPTGDQWDIRRKPRLLIITRKKTRVFLNERGMTDMAMSLGFDVRVAEPGMSTDLAKFARLVNSADVMIGVHGAGLTNMVFLPDGAVLIQVVPFGGLDWLARETFKEPAPAMRLHYLDYHIKPDESTISQQYAADDPVIKDPYAVQKRGWNEISRIYLENQNVKPQLGRLRKTLLEALKHLPHGRHGRTEHD